MPISRVPSLDALRGFVAVGRRMSITLAAQDLFLTQSAVSRQIQTLEQALGCRLFVRRHRAISFTPEGERLFRVADCTLQQLQETVDSIIVRSEHQPVTITASVGFTGLWLMPRLGELQHLHSGIDVRVTAENKLFDLRVEGIDIAIRYCSESAAPAGAQRLFGDVVVPVAHPSLGIDRLDVEVLPTQVLLEYEDAAHPWLQWEEYLLPTKLRVDQSKGILRFNQYDQMIHSAATGQGIALGRRELVGKMLAEGRLVSLQLRNADVDSDYAYWLIRAEQTPRDDVRLVVEWLLSYAQR